MKKLRIYLYNQRDNLMRIVWTLAVLINVIAISALLSNGIEVFFNINLLYVQLSLFALFLFIVALVIIGGSKKSKRLAIEEEIEKYHQKWLEEFKEDLLEFEYEIVEEGDKK